MSKRITSFMQRIESKIGRKIPKIKTSMGIFWTFFWLIITIFVNILFMALVIGGIIIIVFLIVNGEAIDIPLFGSNEKKKEIQ